MMTAAEALVYLLKSDATVANATGGRIYPLVVPGGVIVPAIAYQMISDVPVMSHDGFGNLQITRWQLTIEALTYAQARTLARAIKRKLNGLKTIVNGLSVGPCIVENDTDDYSIPAMQPVARLDVMMTHDEH